MRKLEKPVVVKPVSGQQGHGVSLEVSTRQDMRIPFKAARELSALRRAVSQMVKDEVIVLFYEKLQPIQKALCELAAEPILSLAAPGEAGFSLCPIMEDCVPAWLQRHVEPFSVYLPQSR